MFLTSRGTAILGWVASVAASQQPLFSSAFGYPGVNATYDYVSEFATT